MKVTVNGRTIETTNEPNWTGAGVCYQMLSLTRDEATIALGYPRRVKGNYAIRIDGSKVTLVKRVGEYTSEIDTHVVIDSEPTETAACSADDHDICEGWMDEARTEECSCFCHVDRGERDSPTAARDAQEMQDSWAETLGYCPQCGRYSGEHLNGVFCDKGGRLKKRGE